MPINDPDENDDKPLDPEMEKVRRKMVRLLAVSIGIMFIGLMAVLGAIVYKFSSGTESEPSMAQSQTLPGDDVALPPGSSIALPAGFTVTHTALDGARMMFFGMMEDGAERALVIDTASGAVVSDIAVGRRVP